MVQPQLRGSSGAPAGAPFFTGFMANRYCVFVDAGYLYRAGGLACLGVGDRAAQFLDAEAFVPALSEFCNERALGGLGSWLRTYWYDGAERNTADHEAIGSLPRVKLRMGRLVAGQQKGVDSLIVRDLMVLAGRRAISTAFVLGGDEDLREGVREAQDFGIEVVLLGIEPRTGSNLSDLLVMEADQLLFIDEDVLRPCFWRPFSRPPLATVEISTDDSYELGRRFALSYVAALPRFERQVVLRSVLRFRWTPRALDAELVRRVEAMPSVGNPPEADAVRMARKGFAEGCRALRN